LVSKILSFYLSIVVLTFENAIGIQSFPSCKFYDCSVF